MSSITTTDAQGNVTKYVEMVNEKGNVSAKVRNEVKAQAVNHYKSKGFFLSPNGCLYREIGTDYKTKQPIYEKVELTITMEDPTTKEKRKSSHRKSSAEEIAVPNLF